MRVHPKPKRASTCSCCEEGCGGRENLELGKQRNDKKQSPTVEHKKLYSISSDKPHERE